MKFTPYSEKLMNPKWKRKKTKILKRDDCTCQHCGDTESLQVHHRYYRDDTEPWDYPDTVLITLCADCHRVESDLPRGIRALMGLAYSVYGREF